MPLIIPSPSIILSLPRRRGSKSSVYLPEHDIHAAQNDHHVRDVVPDAHVFEEGEIDEAGRADAVAVGIRRTVADQIKTKLAFRTLDAAVGFAGLRAETAELRLGIDDRAFGNLRQRLLQDADRLAHFQ